MIDDAEHLSDPIDVGSRLAETERNSLLAAQRRKAEPKQVRNPDGSWPTEECVECGEPIGEGRLELGYDTCIDCARTAEVKGKQYAKR